MTAVEIKIADVSSLVKKTNYDANISEIEGKVNNHDHDKCINTSEFNKLTTKVFKVRLAQADLIKKADFDDKLKNINTNITSNKTKQLLVENRLNKLETFDSSCFKGKDNFEEDYLVFKPMYKYLKKIGSIKSISEWKSKGLSLMKSLSLLIIVLLQQENLLAKECT